MANHQLDYLTRCSPEISSQCSIHNKKAIVFNMTKEQNTGDAVIEPCPPSYQAAAGGGQASYEDSKPVPAPLRGYGIEYRVDPTVSFAEFTYWAKVERQEEAEAERLFLERRGPMTPKKMIMSRFSKGVHHENKKMDEKDENATTGIVAPADNGITRDSSSDLTEEWKVASRAMRTAGWSSIFFLITTDILGWSGCP